MRTCPECDGTTFERRELPWPVRIGPYEIAQSVIDDACTGCGWWGIQSKDWARLELLAAQRVLLEHEFTGAVAKDVRKVLGFSRAGLAECLAVSESTIAEWESAGNAAPWFPLALGGLVAADLLAPPKPVAIAYRARIYADDDAWSVEFPDCPGCLTFGSTVEEAKAAAKEALEGWLEVHVMDHDVPPKPAATEGEPIEVDGELGARLARLWFP